MIAGFVLLSAIFIAMMFLREQQLLGMILEHVSRSAPLYFLIASVYFENRFEFYDLVVKRALLLLLSVIVLGVLLAATLPWLDALPGGMARPWLFAVALAPVAMVMPWLMNRAERWLDRMWLGREFTPVEAVKHVLAAMQPATDEQTLIDAAEARLERDLRREDRGAGRRRADPRAGIETDGHPDQPGVGRVAAHRRHAATPACDASSPRIWRCCGRSPACSASCSRTSACSAAGRSRIRSRRSCACNRASRS